MKRVSSVVYCLLLLLALGAVNVGSIQGYKDATARKHNGRQPSSETDDERNYDLPTKSKPLIQLYGGDIVLNERQREILESSDESSPTRARRAVVSSGTDLWPNGVVPYEMDSSLSEEAVNAITVAIQEYTVSTCIRFRPRFAYDLHYVRFHDGGGCYSQVGRSGGEQLISIGPACTRKGVVMHEMFHALGRWHEQSRPDRDQFVQINFNNIVSGFEPNFEPISQVLATTQGVPYDFDSIMHYEYDAFSLNGRPTIEPKDTSVAVTRLGQRNGFSTLDISHINALYCGAPAGEWSIWSAWSECPVSCNGGIQARTRRCINGLECPGTNIEHRTCSEQNCPILASWSSWGEWSGCSQSCGGGRRTRIRRCLNGENCNGTSHEHDGCNTQDCPSIQRWGSWSVWSECSASCAGGSRYRARVCTLTSSSSQCDSPDMQREPCNTNITCGTWPCHSEPCLAGVNHVGCYTLDVLELRPLSSFPSQPVWACAQTAVAATSPTPLFALYNGTCYSSRLLQDFNSQSFGSDSCRNGTGGQSSADLYEITDMLEFEASSTAIESCGADYCTVESPVCSRAVNSWSANLSLAAVLVLLVCWLLSCR